MSCSKSETRGGLGRNIVVQYSFGPIINLRGRITATEYFDELGNQMLSVIQTLFPNNDEGLKTTMHRFTHLQLLSDGLKSMKVNFYIILGHHNHPI
jgi:hypothetical protein